VAHWCLAPSEALEFHSAVSVDGLSDNQG
jgi:hypothetical protein